MKKFALLMILALSVSACSFGEEEAPVDEVADQVSEEDEVMDEEEENEDEVEEDLSEVNDYELRDITSDNSWRQQLIGVDKNGEEEVLINNTMEALLEIDDDPKTSLMEYIELSNGMKIFKSIYPDMGDVVIGSFYYYNPQSGLNRLGVSDVLSGRSGYSVETDSVDRSVWLVGEGEEIDGLVNKMYLVDFLNDEYELLVELEEGEAFNAGVGGLDIYYEVQFSAENNTVSYTVFDQNSKNGDYQGIDSDLADERKLREDVYEL